MTTSGDLTRRLLTSWSGHWRLAIEPHANPSIAVAQAIALRQAPADAVSILVSEGRYDEAENVLVGPLDPPLPPSQREELHQLLTAGRAGGRSLVGRALDGLELRAKGAGGRLIFDRSDILALSELDLALAREEVALVEAQVSDLEADLHRRFLDRIARESPSATTAIRVETCLERRRWDAAERLLSGAQGVSVAANLPTDVPAPPAIDMSPLGLAAQLLDSGEAVRARHGWRPEDDESRRLLGLLVSHDPAPSDVAVALDQMLQPDSVSIIDGDRVVLASLEILPVPRPKFVGPDGLAVAMPGATVGDDEVTLDVGIIETSGGPRLGVREILQVVLAPGDRRIALLRVIGRQQRAEVVVSDLAAVANVDWALDWAFDLVAPRVAAPLVEVLLATTAAHPRLTEALFVATVPPPGSRAGWLDEQILEDALARTSTQVQLLDELLAGLGRDMLAFELLVAVEQFGQPDRVTSIEDLELFAIENLQILRDTDRVPPEAVAAAVTRLEDEGHLVFGPNGYWFSIGLVRALDRRLVARTLDSIEAR